MPLLAIAAAFFAAFTVGYVLFAAAIVYHLTQYTLPGAKFLKLTMAAFVFLSGLFWLFGLYFLFQIPR